MRTVMERLFDARRTALREYLPDKGAEFRIGWAVAEELSIDPRLREMGDPDQILADIAAGSARVFGLPLKLTSDADDYLGLVYEIRG